MATTTILEQTTPMTTNMTSKIPQEVMWEDDDDDLVYDSDLLWSASTPDAPQKSSAAAEPAALSNGIHVHLLWDMIEASASNNYDTAASNPFNGDMLIDDDVTTLADEQDTVILSAKEQQQQQQDYDDDDDNSAWLTEEDTIVADFDYDDEDDDMTVDPTAFYQQQAVFRQQGTLYCPSQQDENMRFVLASSY